MNSAKVSGLNSAKTNSSSILSSFSDALSLERKRFRNEDAWLRTRNACFEFNKVFRKGYSFKEATCPGIENLSNPLLQGTSVFIAIGHRLSALCPTSITNPECGTGKGPLL
uniref:Uncharacterized protein n=1 Tax=Picea glauca TaxID=3330 RepID=A0A124GP45_PICGL|nr:hypothetical protein ABT39_MTgene657 [Picea glauca]